MRKFIIFAILILALPVLVLAYFQPATLTDGVDRVAVFTQEQAAKYFGMGYVLEENVGATTENTNRIFFKKGITEGGYRATSSTIAAYTTTAGDFLNTPSVIAWTPNRDLTISLSSTSTFGYVPKVGDVAEVYLLNASSTAAAAITLAAKDANLDMQYGEATGGDLVLSGLDWGKLTIIRKSALQVSVLFDEMTEAD